MIRYRSAKTEPGVNPPASIESDEASRPTGDEDGLRRRAASATEGLATLVAICETDEIASPQEGQKRKPSGNSAEQLGQRITLPESYRAAPDTLPSSRPRPEGQDLVRAAAAFSALFQQRPVLEEGAIFKAEWFRFYEGDPADLERIVLSFDTAFKTGADNDYSACTVWGVKANKYYLLYAWRGKVEFPELRQKVAALVRQWRPAATLVEDSASGQPLIQELKRSPELRIVPVKPARDKVTRATSITPMIANGAVLLPGSCPWREMYLEELLAFPNGTHDDLVDTTTQALTYLVYTPSGGGVTLEMLSALSGPTKHMEKDPYRRAEMVELPEGYDPVQIRRRRG
jgi:predicted phage terminase large subunit-like protein